METSNPMMTIGEIDNISFIANRQNRFLYDNTQNCSTDCIRRQYSSAQMVFLDERKKAPFAQMSMNEAL
jgi:hypothetical protein